MSEKGDRISNGESCRRLEDQIARMSGADYAVATCNCTQALMVMLAVSTKNGVVLAQVPSFTWRSTLIAINAQKYEQGALLQDIDYDSWTIKYFPPHSKPAIAVAVDTFGNDCSPESKVPVFYDRAHSLGVKFKHLGLASAISLSPSKIATGCEGGMILTNKSAFVEAMRDARDDTCRMPEPCAIIALNNIRYLPEFLEWKRESYDHYKKAFPDFKFQECQNSNHQVIGMLVDSHEQRDRIVKLCPEIEFKAYYQPLHDRFNLKLNVPVTDDIYRRILCLPSWYGVDRNYVVRRIKEVVEGGSRST